MMSDEFRTDNSESIIAKCDEILLAVQLIKSSCVNIVNPCQFHKDRESVRDRLCDSCVSMIDRRQ